MFLHVGRSSYNTQLQSSYDMQLQNLYSSLLVSEVVR